MNLLEKRHEIMKHIPQNPWEERYICLHERWIFIGKYTTPGIRKGDGIDIISNSHFQMLYMYGIFTYIWPKCMVNVGKQAIHWAFGDMKSSSNHITTEHFDERVGSRRWLVERFWESARSLSHRKICRGRLGMIVMKESGQTDLWQPQWARICLYKLIFVAFYHGKSPLNPPFGRLSLELSPGIKHANPTEAFLGSVWWCFRCFSPRN